MFRRDCEAVALTRCHDGHRNGGRLKAIKVRVICKNSILAFGEELYDAVLVGPGHFDHDERSKPGDGLGRAQETLIVESFGIDFSDRGSDAERIDWDNLA